MAKSSFIFHGHPKVGGARGRRIRFDTAANTVFADSQAELAENTANFKSLSLPASLSNRTPNPSS